MDLVHNETGPGHNETGTQWDWYTRLGHNRYGTQWYWCTMGLVTKWDRYTMKLGHYGPGTQ